MRTLTTKVSPAIPLIIFLLISLALFACDTSGMFYQENEVTIEKPEILAPVPEDQIQPSWMNAELRTTTMTVSLSWSDNTGIDLEWPDEIEGIGIRIMQSINGEVPTQIQRILLTASQEEKIIDELPAYKRLPTGEEYFYTYTVEEIDGDVYQPEIMISGSEESGYTGRIKNTMSEDGKIIIEVPKVYERGDLTMQVDYWEIIQREIYDCTNIEAFKTFVQQYSGINTNGGKKIDNKWLFCSSTGLIAGVSSDAELLNTEAGKFDGLDYMEYASYNRSVYNSLISNIDSTRKEVRFDTFLDDNLIQGEEIVNTEDEDGNTILAFVNFKTPEKQTDETNRKSTKYTFKYRNARFGVPIFNKTFYWTTWQEERIYKKYYYNVKKICITKPSTCKYDEASFILRQGAEKIMRHYYSGDRMYILFADQETEPINGVVAEFDVIDFNNHMEKSHVIVRFD